MKSFKHIALYGIYFIGVVIFFLYYLFPSDSVKAYILSQMQSATGGYQIVIDKIKPVFPPGLRLYGIRISPRGNSWLEADSLRIIPKPWTFFGSVFTLKFECQLYGGLISGNVGIAGRSFKNADIEATIEKIALEKIGMIETLSSYRINGSMAGKVRFQYQPRQSKGSGRVVLTDLDIQLPEAVIGLDRLNMQSVDGDILLKSRRQLEIQRCVFKGKQVNGDIAGLITVKMPFDASALSIRGTARPHPSFIAEMAKEFPVAALFENKTGQGSIPFRIDGTLKNPAFSLE